jgi:hypothetical protein
MPLVQIGAFSVEVPPDWTLSTVIIVAPSDEAATDLDELRGPTTTPFQRNFIATMEQVGAAETPENYVRRQLEGLRKAGVERRQVGPLRTVELPVGALHGLLMEQVITGPTGEWVHQMQLVCIKQGVAHTLIVSHLEGEPFDRARDEFEKMLLSFA